MRKLLVLQKMSAKIKERFTEALLPYFEIEFASSFDPLYLKEKIAGATVCFGSFLPDVVIESANNLKVFQLAGTGVDRLNLQLLEKKGITICKTQAHSKYVAEFATAMLHSLVKKITCFDRLLRANDIKSLRSLPGIDFNSYTLFGKYIGIIGYGHIGKSIHQLLQAYTTHFLINSATNKPESELLGGTYAGLEELIKRSDVVFVACPLTGETRGMIGIDAFQSASRKSIWINISRGEIIDFNALIYALEHKLIGGFAIDNWYPEIPDAEKQLSLFDNIVMSPYRAINISGEDPNISDALDNLLRFGKGESLTHIVNYAKGY
ncbi:MAG TPA: NAD(P)-dependent oxidoreductase [Agriterribacter sp.]|nr:NAD(P)-dependent oxidoreductase [Agriterribacter sp.]HTN07271.1 NAD(P)-dependent oxidoreductase [Agriterribacter sp.]